MKRAYISILVLMIIASTSCMRTNISSHSEKADSLIIGSIFPFQDKHCHASSIAELPNHDLLVVWFQGSGERTADDVKIMGARLNHRTGVWCEPFIMTDTPEFPDINPVLFIDKSERLWLVWYTVLAYQWESSLLKYRISENYMQKTGAPEWKWQDVIHVKADGSAPEGIGKNDFFVKTLERKYSEYHESLVASGAILPGGNGTVTEEMWNSAIARYFENAKGTGFIRPGTDVDENGEKVKTDLGYPLLRRIGWQTRNKPIFIGKKMLLPLYSDGFDFSLIAITNDQGATWSFSEPIVGAGSIQPALLLCKDSTITALMRDNGPAPHRLMRSTSSDVGKTWSTVTDTEIPNPGSAADVITLKSGNWAMVLNDTDDGRHRLSVWLSEDEGQTWPFRKSLVDAIPGSETRAHYPAIIQGSDGLLHVSYTNQIPAKDGKGNVKNIAHAVFSEQWIKN